MIFPLFSRILPVHFLHLVYALFFGLFAIHQLHAQNNPQHHLQSVQQALENAKIDLQEKQQAQKKASQTLQHAQSEIARIQKEINALTQKQNQSMQQLNALQNQLHRLQTEIGNTKTQVSRLLSANYKNRQPHSVVLFLNNADTNQKSRFLHYSRYINTANNQVLNQLTQQKEQLHQQEIAIQNQLKKLQALNNEKNNRINQLRKHTNSVQNHHQKLNQQIANQNQKINRLHQDEQRLSQLIKDLSNKSTPKKAPNQTNTTKPTNTNKNNQANNHKKPSSNLTREDLNLQANDHFTRLQGHLHRPSNGQLSGRFGQARNENGNWRGLFFQTAPSNVRNIAEGIVAYTGNVSGYGNTIVINHNDGYISVYTGLNSISAVNNTTISAGQVIGQSGTLPSGEQGLYFELRYRGTPINPISWFK